MVLPRAPSPHPKSPRTTQGTSLARDPRRHLLHRVRSGCAWRLLPHDFPPWKTVHHYLRAWRIDGTWERIHAALRERVRVRLKRDPRPSAGVVDTASRSRAPVWEVISVVTTEAKLEGQGQKATSVGRHRRLRAQSQGAYREGDGLRGDQDAPKRRRRSVS